MSSELNYLNDVKEKWERESGNLFLKAYSNSFRDGSLKNKAKGLKQKQVVDDLLDLVKKSVAESKNLLHLIVDDTEKVKKYLDRYSNELQQISDCSQCRCIDCISECKFSSCGNCKQCSRVTYCDKSEACMSNPSKLNYIFLYNETEGRDIQFNILAIIESVKYDRKYVLLQDNDNQDDKQIFRVIETVEEDNYEPLDNDSELEYIVSIFLEN